MLWVNDNGEFTNSAKYARENNCITPSARELYDYIEQETDKTGSWDAVDWDAYDQLARYCGIDIDEYDNTEEFMEDCLKSIEEEEK